MVTKNIMPKVIVILVNYNSLIHTKECIRSIKKSTYENIEIIVVDNDSEENCQELSDEISDVVLIRNKENLGFAAANNIGIDYALQSGAEFILLLNNDTVVADDCIEELVNCSEDNSRNGIVTGKILNYYERDLIWYAGGDISYRKGDAVIYGFGKKDTGQYDLPRICTFASGCCMLIPREIANDIRIQEDYFLYYEDSDYCVRIVEDNKKIYYCPRAVIFHKESVSTNKFSYIYSYYFARNRLLFIRKNIKPVIRVVPYIATILTLIKRCVMGLLRPKSVLDGIVDFMKGKKGKCIRKYI